MCKRNTMFFSCVPAPTLFFNYLFKRTFFRQTLINIKYMSYLLKNLSTNSNLKKNRQSNYYKLTETFKKRTSYYYFKILLTLNFLDRFSKTI